MNNASIPFSLFLFTAGAILFWAVDTTVSGLDIKVVGVILMIVGAVALALGLLFWASFAPYARRRPHDRQDADL